MLAHLRQLLRTSALRLALRYALLNVAVLAIALASLFVFVNRYVGQQIESALTGELAALASLTPASRIDSVHVLASLRGSEQQLRFYRLEAADGHLLAGNVPAWPAALHADRRLRNVALPLTQLDHDGEALPRLPAVATRLPDGGRLFVAQAPGALEDLREIALGLAAAVLGLAALLAVALGVSLGWQWLQRIEAINRTAARIAAGDFTQRVAVGTRGDEFDLLGRHLNAMLVRIEAAVAGMREVSDNVAHDLRRPLARLKTRAEIALNQPRETAAYREALAQTVADADELMHGFDALLSIARLEAGSELTEPEAFDLGAVVRRVAELYADDAEQSGRPFTFDVAAALSVSGRPALIAQALVNLLDNAFKYTAPDCAVSVRLYRADARAVLVVADRGGGIAAGQRAQMTERFVRGDAARTLAGSGLGLALVKAVVLAHGGTLNLTDTPGGGLSVDITLPLIASTTG
jgi:Signal transduction histidine kinase